MVNENQLQRFQRLLALVPILLQNQGIAIDSLSRELGIGEDQLIKDLYTLWISGRPGYSHLELIDLDFEDGTIQVLDPQNLDKPLKLDSFEKANLLMALAHLYAISDSSMHLDIENLITKIHKSSLFSFQNTSSRINESAIFKDIQRAIKDGLRINIEYFNVKIQNVSIRNVQPKEMILRDDFWYLNASDGSKIKTFRVDRISKVDIDFKIQNDENLTIADSKYREISFRLEAEYRYLADFLHSWLDYDERTEKYVMKCFDIENLAKSLLIFGNHIYDVEPELIEERKLAAQAVLACYTE